MTTRQNLQPMKIPRTKFATNEIVPLAMFLFSEIFWNLWQGTMLPVHCILLTLMISWHSELQRENPGLRGSGENRGGNPTKKKSPIFSLLAFFSLTLLAKPLCISDWLRDKDWGTRWRDWVQRSSSRRIWRRARLGSWRRRRTRAWRRWPGHSPHSSSSIAARSVKSIKANVCVVAGVSSWWWILYCPIMC